MNMEYNGDKEVSNPVLSNVSKEQLRQIILDYGAHVCGFADIDRFSDAPNGFHPCDIYSDCKSIVVFGVALPKGLYMANSSFINGHFNNEICKKVDDIAYKVAMLIEREHDGITVPIPADRPYEDRDSEHPKGRGFISMKHIAVEAGLGTLGKSTLFVNKIFGNRLTLGCVLTNVKMNSDIYAEPLCLPNCKECIENCPTGALHIGEVSQKECRMNAYTVDCNRCRTICPMRFGES